MKKVVRLKTHAPVDITPTFKESYTSFNLEVSDKSKVKISDMEADEHGVIITNKDNMKILVPWANIHYLHLAEEEKKASKRFSK